MHDVGDGAAEQTAFRCVTEIDTLVVLDLGHCGAEHVAQRCVGDASHALTSAGKDEQRITGASHTCSEVVECEQILESCGVAFFVLERVDERELLLDEGLVPSCEGFEHLVDLAAKRGLLTCEAERADAHVVDSACDLTDLLPRGDTDRLEVDRLDVAPFLMFEIASGRPTSAARRVSLRRRRSGRIREAETSSARPSASVRMTVTPITVPQAFRLAVEARSSSVVTIRAPAPSRVSW